MPRVLGASIINTMGLADKLSGSALTFHYRMPTTRERVAYDNAMARVRNKNSKQSALEVQVEFGAKILMGYEYGDFLIPDGNGQEIPLGCYPAQSHYREDWKDIVTDQAADLVQILAVQVFVLSVSPIEKQSVDPDEPDDEPNDETGDGQAGTEAKPAEAVTKEAKKGKNSEAA